MTTHALMTSDQLGLIVQQINAGVFVMDLEWRVLFWNRYMETHSGHSAQTVVGKNLLTLFPELPARWFQKQVQAVATLKSAASLSWKEKPYLFKFPHGRVAQRNIEYMRQDILLAPLFNEQGEVIRICATLLDATDTYIYETQLNQALDRLEKNSRIDGLTKLFNRAYWEQRFSEEIARFRRYPGSLTVIMADIDFFKQVNDTHGHLTGDIALRHVADLIKIHLRETDIAGRYGGEEFGIVLPNTHLKNALLVAERIRQTIEKNPLIFQNEIIPLTLSLGVAQFSKGTSSHEQLLMQADQALYQAKQQGRNLCRVFTTEILESVE